MTRYPLAERFKAPQGEGLYTGTQMAFVRLVGCSVGQSVCTACDTDFATMRADLGGGLFTADEIVEWAGGCEHLCVTGGEPFDRDIREIIFAAASNGMTVHVETSGTKSPDWLVRDFNSDSWLVMSGNPESDNYGWQPYAGTLWVTVSPKPGYLDNMVAAADEIKVIIGGLGDGPGWPTVDKAVEWAENLGQLVYVQPRNDRLDIDIDALQAAIAVVAAHPALRLSVQAHKMWRTR